MSNLGARASGSGATLGSPGGPLPLARTFHFEVTLVWSPPSDDPARPPPRGYMDSDNRICSAGFQECIGLAINLPFAVSKNNHEGGNNGFVHNLPGLATYGTLTFKRGMMYRGPHVLPELWYWVQSIAYRSQHPPWKRMYCDGLIKVLGKGGQVVKWQFQRGLPTQLTGPTLLAMPGANAGIAIETLKIAPGRLWLTR